MKNYKYRYKKFRKNVINFPKNYIKISNFPKIIFFQKLFSFDFAFFHANNGLNQIQILQNIFVFFIPFFVFFFTTIYVYSTKVSHWLVELFQSQIAHVVLILQGNIPLKCIFQHHNRKNTIGKFVENSTLNFSTKLFELVSPTVSSVNKIEKNEVSNKKKIQINIDERFCYITVLLFKKNVHRSYCWVILVLEKPHLL